MENKPVIETNVVKPSLSYFENEVENRLLSHMDEYAMDTKIREIEEYLNSNHGFGKTEAEKDALYGKAQELWNQYAQILREVNFTFYLNKKQYQYMIELLRDKLEYDVNTLFLAIDLTNMLGEWRDVGYGKEEKEVRGYLADATEVTFIYHLISKHKVRGLTHASYRFAEILTKIGAISKIIAYYDTAAKNLKKDIELWTASFDGIEVEGKDWGKQEMAQISL